MQTIIDDEAISIARNIHDLYSVAVSSNSNAVLAVKPQHVMGSARSCRLVNAWRNFLAYRVRMEPEWKINLPWESGEVPNIGKINDEVMGSQTDRRRDRIRSIDQILARPHQAEIRQNIRKEEIGVVSNTEYHGRTMIEYQLSSLAALPTAFLMNKVNNLGAWKGYYPEISKNSLADFDNHIDMVSCLSNFDGDLEAFLDVIYRDINPLSLGTMSTKLKSFKKQGYDTESRAVAIMIVSQVLSGQARKYDYASIIEEWYELGASTKEVYDWLTSPNFKNYPEVIKSWIKAGLNASKSEEWLMRGVNDPREAGMANKSAASWAVAWDS